MPTFHLLLLATALCGRASASGAPTAQAPARGIVADPAQTGWAGMQLWRAVRGMVAGAWERGNCARNRRHIADGAPCVRPTPVEDDPDAPNQEAAAHPTGPAGSFAGFQSFEDPLHDEDEIHRMVAQISGEKDQESLPEGSARDGDAGADAAAALERLTRGVLALERQSEMERLIRGALERQAERPLIADEADLAWLAGGVHAGQPPEQERQEQAGAGLPGDELGFVLGMARAAVANTPDDRDDPRAVVPDRPEQDPEDSSETMDDAAMFAAIFPDHAVVPDRPEQDPSDSGEGMDDAAIFPGPEKSPDAEEDDTGIPDDLPDDDADSEHSWGAPEEAETPTPPRPKPKSSSTAIMTASALFAAAVAVAL